MVGVPVLSSRTPLGRVVRVLSKESPHKLRAVRSSVFGTRPNAALRNGNGKRGSYCLLAPAIALTYIRNQEWSDRCGTRQHSLPTSTKRCVHASSHASIVIVDVVHKPHLPVFGHFGLSSVYRWVDIAHSSSSAVAPRAPWVASTGASGCAAAQMACCTSGSSIALGRWPATSEAW